jgi:hypothetical protein
MECRGTLKVNLLKADIIWSDSIKDPYLIIKFGKETI